MTAYKYKGYEIILGGFGWAVYGSDGNRLRAFDDYTQAERFIDGLEKEV